MNRNIYTITSWPTFMLYPRMNCDIIHMMAIELDLIIWFIGVQLCTTICQLQITTLIDVLSEQKQRKACENMRIASLPVIPWTLDRTGRLLESTHTQTFNQVPRLFNQLRFYSTLLISIWKVFISLHLLYGPGNSIKIYSSTCIEIDYDHVFRMMCDEQIILSF